MKMVLVTGAAGGIGRELADAFVTKGYGVLAVDSVAQPAGLPCMHYIRVDLRRTVEDPRFAAGIFDAIRQLLAGSELAALVNNAAVQVLAPAEELTREDWQSTLGINVMAPFVWSQALLPELEASRGMVLNISSIHARLTKPGFVAYATSKAALSGLTRALAVDLRGRVRVNAIEPAAIDTPMLRDGFRGAPNKLEELRRLHPTRSIGTPGDLASLAVFMVEAGGGFLNGATVAFDGGISGCLLDPESL